MFDVFFFFGINLMFEDGTLSRKECQYLYPILYKQWRICIFFVIVIILAVPSFTSPTPQFCEATDETSSTLKCRVWERMDVTLGCQHEAYPQATLRVTFNDSNIATAGTNVALKNGDIIIRSFDRSRNTGQYKCFANNTVEGDTKSSSITYILSKGSIVIEC